MSHRYFHFLLTILFIYCAVTHLEAQTMGAGANLLNEDYFGFEKGSDAWTFEKAANWSLSTAQVASGQGSLKFSRQTKEDQAALYSIETEYTIMKVRNAKNGNGSYIVASTYEGTLLRVAYDGGILWKNQLSGFMNHDLWCEDITGDGNDEILVANADGTVYCLNDKGKLMWEFSQNEAPMYAVCVVKKENKSYVVCGGFDKSMYYVSSEGALEKEIKSSNYSVEKPWGSGIIPEKFVHNANFIRRITRADGSHVLAVNGSNNHMQVKGSIYLFEVLADKPFATTKIEAPTVLGDFRVVDPDKDGTQEILLGTSGHQNEAGLVRFDPQSGTMQTYKFEKLGFGYSVVQSEAIPDGNSFRYLVLVGRRIFLLSPDLAPSSAEELLSRYSFNDMWKDTENGKIILASSQSGGSCIHVVDTQNPEWKELYKDLTPPGKIKKILDNTAEARTYLSGFTKPSWQRNTLPVYFMTESFPTALSQNVANDISENYQSPLFLGGKHMPRVENWDRSSMTNEKYRNKRDRRKKYELSQAEVLDLVLPWYQDVPGIAYWGGHGNDPYMFSLETTKKVLDGANGKKTVLIYPELEDHTEDFAWVLNDLIYPLAEHAKEKNGNIFVRTKHAFWQSNIYLPMWSRLMSGEFADVFVPSMEETTDKSMELSVAGRIGIWASGAVSSWGSRSVPDNPSFDRSRQFSHQRLPNHFLRHMVYNISYGAQYINNFAVDQDYMSLLWELIAKGALYVPESHEIVSFSPVHLSMLEPDEHYVNEASNVKWTTFYDQEFEAKNPFVFSRLNGTWPAAPVTTWDFSHYAAGVKDRRQNFLPPYENGLVLITPPQNGANAANKPLSGALKDRLHPLYKDILKEYYTDGRYYYSSDGAQKYGADQYATTIATDIGNSASLLPLTVTGEVAWVAAQTDPTHLRLTIIDGGYLNPNDRKATVHFHTVSPVSVRDVLDNKNFPVVNKATSIDIPCGLFRFLDITLDKQLD
ncbi:MAG: hypothetical protein RIG77_19435 [Cyclobacteriaceae bacterium]